ncbi:tail fiber domain-containing protein, partial [Dolichospermum sp. ST_sed4]|nr:tail fiber domain-containing protein [Dolichospermum sp. ST_sed4]
ERAYAIKNNSVAFGEEVYATGISSYVFGSYASAEGNSSFAFGSRAHAYATGSMAFGLFSSADAYNSIAFGPYCDANGNSSLAIGNGARTHSANTTVIGQYNKSYSGNLTGWDENDPALIVGNGKDASDRRTAIMVLKNGNVGIGIVTPSQKLEIGGDNSKIYLNSTTANNVYFNTAGVGAPTTTTRSYGTKLVLYPSLNATYVDFALGIDNNTIWYSVPGATSTFSHKFYAGTTEIMRIRGDGKVGIGTTNPSIQTRLHVADNQGNNIGVIRSESTFTGSEVHYAGAFIATTGTTGIGVYAAGSNCDFVAGGDGTDYASWSSIRWKANIKTIENPVDKLLNIRGVYFDWDTEHGGGHDIGFIGEEVYEVLPEIVMKDPDNQDYVLGLDYSAITPVLVEAIKEQQSQIESQNQENRQLRAELESLKERMAVMESILGKN